MSEIDKSFLSRLRKPKVVADAPKAVYGVVRGGTPGVGIYHQGRMTAWGGNETAAWENHRMSRSINAAMGKSDSWEVPMDHFEPQLPRRRRNYGAGNTVGKRMTGASTGVVKPKKVGPTRVAARTANASVPAIGAMPSVNGRQLTPNMVGKRDRSYNPEHNRQRRLGIATAVTAGAGGGSIASGVRDVRRDTGTLRGIDPGVVHVPKEPSKPRSQKRGASGRMERLSPAEHEAEQKAYNERLGHRVRRVQTREGLERARAAGERGMVVSRRSAGKLGLGAGLLATSGGMLRYAHSRSNREWR